MTIEESIVSDPLGGGTNCEPNGNAFDVTRSIVTDSTCGAAEAKQQRPTSCRDSAKDAPAD